MGLKVDAIHVVASALHDQSEQQHQNQQGGGTDRHHGVHRTVDQGPRREDTDLPAGLLNSLGLDQPGLLVEIKGLRCLGRIRLDGGNRFTFGIGQWPRGAEAPVWTRGQDHNPVVVGQ
ncbi:hypothetical protein D3C77_543480 [compost metagenome]